MREKKNKIILKIFSVDNIVVLRKDIFEGVK